MNESQLFAAKELAELRAECVVLREKLSRAPAAIEAAWRNGWIVGFETRRSDELGEERRSMDDAYQHSPARLAAEEMK